MLPDSSPAMAPIAPPTHMWEDRVQHRKSSLNLGISAIEYVLPSKSLSVRELAEAGLLVSRAEQLQPLDSNDVISAEIADELALRAAAALLDNCGVSPESVDLLLYAGAIAPSHHIAGGSSLALQLPGYQIAIRVESKPCERRGN